MIKKILKSKHYRKIMYMLIAITLILIFSNFINILKDSKGYNNQKFTGFAISDNETKNINTNSSNIKMSTQDNQQKNEANNQMYSDKTYALFYLFLISLIGLIGFLFAIFIIPKIKHLT